MTSLVTIRWLRTRPDFSRFGFPLTFALAFILVFSFSATKLPHYTWPVWPALALAGAICFSLVPGEKPGPLVRYFLSLPSVIFVLISFALALTPYSFYLSLPLGEAAHTLLKYGHGLPLLARFLLATAGIIAASLAYQKTRFTPAFVFFAIFCAFAWVAALTPTIQELWISPIQNIALALHERNARTEDCIRYAGPHSPTLSLALGPNLYHNRGCEPTQGIYLIVPEWKLKECAERQFKVLEHSAFLNLCGK